MNHYESMSYIDKKRQFESELPQNLDAKLKDAYIATSMIGPPFYWKKLKGNALVLKGFKDSTLTLSQEGPVWSVVFKTPEGTQRVFECLEYDEAFKAAREFAFDQRREFLFSDRDASFKRKTISDKQLEIVKASGMLNGIEQLTSGQAGALMDCGVLRKPKKPEVSNDCPF